MTISSLRFLSRDAAIRELSRLAVADVPFFFLVDYAMRRSLVVPIASADPALLRFDINGLTNETTLVAKAFSAISDNHKPRWHVYPPTPADYRHRFDIVHRALHRGDSFLTNLTCRFPIETDLSPADIYAGACAPYRIWLRDSFVCFSPEPFVRIADNVVSSFPMKGTIRADIPDAEARLMADAKEAAEHATIVDLIRNDLSLVASCVRVRRYRYVERLTTNEADLLQTSSEICGMLPTDWRCRFGEILFAQLPAGSVTGAPKDSTLRTIAAAEGYDRGFYTGVAGCYVDGRVDSCVLIRFIDVENGRIFYKAGGGITAMSRPDDEYREVIAKAYVPIR